MIECIIVIVTFVAIVCAAQLKLIDGCVTGTLFGTVIGYGLKNIGKSRKK